MIYETKSGAQYAVVVWDGYVNPYWCIGCKSKSSRKWKVSRAKAFRCLFSTPETAETTLKAHADKHKWKEIEG